MCCDTVVYIVKKAGAGGRSRVSLVISETRVAPVKKISIPRLELLAALLLARLITTVQQALKSVMEISQTVCFSDSMTVLYWLKGENSLKQFCDNPVKEINRTTDRDSWFHKSALKHGRRTFLYIARWENWYERATLGKSGSEAASQLQGQLQGRIARAFSSDRLGIPWI